MWKRLTVFPVEKLLRIYDTMHCNDVDDKIEQLINWQKHPNDDEDSISRGVSPSGTPQMEPWPD